MRGMKISPEKLERITVFQDTIRRCNSNEHLKNAIEKSIAEEKFVKGVEKIETKLNRYKNGCDIVVSKKRSFEAAEPYAKQGKKVCVLNFASATRPGGGVENGASAQEECLCRCSTLFACISDEKVQSPFHQKHRELLVNGEMSVTYNDDRIYTPGVVVFKRDIAIPSFMPEEEWYEVDVVTCAAPKLKEQYTKNAIKNGVVIVTDEELETIHYNRTKKILELANHNGCEVVILGAFGCGAFMNPPEIVSKGMIKAVNDMKNAFEIVEFAVYCADEGAKNYKAFSKEIKSNEI